MHELAIIGGGLVGYTAALALAKAGFKIVLLEEKKPELSKLSLTEARAIVLAHTSVLFYRHIGLWPQLESQATPVREVVISEQGTFGKCRIKAEDYQLDALGQVVPATALYRVLFEAVQAHPLIELKAPFQVSSLETHADRVCINHEIEARCVLACDGTQSFTREYFHLPVTEKNYQQRALVANLTLSASKPDQALQRFTELGVLALLPLGNQRFTSVLTVSEDKADNFLQTSEQDYCAMIQRLLGQRHARVADVGQRFSYPIRWIKADELVAGRTLLMGNAAHTISPIAAQGFNLALRDLAMLFDKISGAADPGDPLLLANYAQECRTAQGTVMKLTDQLNDWLKPRALAPVRGASLFFLDQFSPLKKALAYSLMGLSSHGGSLTREDLHDL